MSSAPEGNAGPPRQARGLELVETALGPPSIESGRPSARRDFSAQQWRQLAWITAGALAIFFTLRLLPTGTNLSHMDFRVDARGANSIEFCDPLNPQFIPVVAARSPVTMAIATLEPPQTGREVHATITLRTGSGKPIAPEDLLFSHTRRLHLMVIDPTLSDYQHVHPEPGKKAGEWTFAVTPRRAGIYRVFADFTPAVTARGLYASVDLPVASGVTGARVSEPGARGKLAEPVIVDGVRYTLSVAQSVVRARQPMDLRFVIERVDGQPVALEPVMDAPAHLVAFDTTRSGFAHLHPAGLDLAATKDDRRWALNFKLTIPNPGDYVIWAQVKIAGREQFVPFALPVE